MVKKTFSFKFIALIYLLAMETLCCRPIFARALVDGPQGFDPHYERCVAQVLRHPLRQTMVSYQNGLGVFESDSSFLDDTDRVCRCVGLLEVKERERSRHDGLSYFFSGRADYFAKLDTCLLNEASQRHYKEFNKIFTFDQIIPLIQVKLKSWRPPMVALVRGRIPAQDIQFCMVEKVLQSCHKLNSLFFTYRCLKEKLKASSFYQEIQNQCHQRDVELGSQGSRI